MWERFGDIAFTQSIILCKMVIHLGMFHSMALTNGTLNFLRRYSILYCSVLHNH